MKKLLTALLPTLICLSSFSQSTSPPLNFALKNLGSDSTNQSSSYFFDFAIDNSNTSSIIINIGTSVGNYNLYNDTIDLTSPTLLLIESREGFNKYRKMFNINNPPPFIYAEIRSVANSSVSNPVSFFLE